MEVSNLYRVIQIGLLACTLTAYGHARILTVSQFRSLQTSWTATPQGVDVKGSTFSVHQAGTAWTNYVVNFEAKVVRTETGWMVYGVPLFGFRFTLAADNDVVGPPYTLRITEPFSAGTVLQASRKAESKLSVKRIKQNKIVRTVRKINIALI
jgi:hypothetical protein